MGGSAIRAGVLLPPRDALPELAGEIGSVLSAYVDALDSNRRIDLLFAAPEGTPAQRAAMARELVEKEDPLALVASFTDGADAELAAMADEVRVPVLATLSSSPRSSIAPGAYLRDLCGGVVEQSAALIRSVGAKSIALLHTDGTIGPPIAQCASGVFPIDASTVSAAALRERDFAAVLFAGAGPAVLRILGEMRALDWWPPLLFAGAPVSPSTFDRVRPSGGVWVALPTSARDQTTAALNAYLDLVKRQRLPVAHQFSQFAALTSLQIFLDALRRCEPDRPSLLRAIDETRSFHSGLFPRLTYGPERHIGSTGAWVIAVHRGRSVSPVWVDTP